MWQMRTPSWVQLTKDEEPELINLQNVERIEPYSEGVRIYFSNHKTRYDQSYKVVKELIEDNP